MTKRTLILANREVRQRAKEAIDAAPDGYAVTIGEPNRTTLQNSAQWPYLEGFAQQKQICINGVMVNGTSDDWKAVLTGCFNGEMRMAAFDGKVIMLPQRTSQMGKKAFGEWFEFLVAMAAQSGVDPVYKTPRRDDRAYQD